MSIDAAVLEHLPLARRLARRYARPGQPVEDLEQVAYVGLVKAVRRFDATRGTAFTSFAVPTIVGEIKRHCRDTAWSAHVPRPVQERVLRLRAAMTAHQGRLGREPTVDELADWLGCSHEEVIEARLAERCLAPVSLDAPVHEEDGMVSAEIDRLGAEDPGYDMALAVTTVEGAMAMLDDHQLELLRLRYAEDLTHPQIAARLDVSSTRVGRLLDQALGRVRGALEPAA